MHFMSFIDACYAPESFISIANVMDKLLIIKFLINNALFGHITRCMTTLNVGI
jgi:hypothetical protein